MIINVLLQSSLILNTLVPPGTPMFITEALCLVSNVQLVKQLLL